MIVTDLATIERLAEEAYANESIFSVDLADYANLKLSTDYLKAAKLETPSLTHECFDTIAQLIQEMGPMEWKKSSYTSFAMATILVKRHPMALI